MPKNTPSKELLNAITEQTIEALANIEQLHVCSFASDTSAAIQSGAVLLSIASLKNDDRGDGFRYLIGLPRGREVTPYLSNYFQR